MEISFRKIELEDRELLQGYLSQKTYRSCDLVFANIYLWSRKYHTEFAIVEKTLIFCGFQEDGAPSITFPIGEQGQIKRRWIKCLRGLRHRMQKFICMSYRRKSLNCWRHGTRRNLRFRITATLRIMCMRRRN